MKKILIVEVPDDNTGVFVIYQQANNGQLVATEFKEITLPTAEEIHANAVKYHQSMGAGWTGVDFEAGANWLLKKITDENPTGN